MHAPVSSAHAGRLMGSVGPGPPLLVSGNAACPTEDGSAPRSGLRPVREPVRVRSVGSVRPAARFGCASTGMPADPPVGSRCIPAGFRLLIPRRVACDRVGRLGFGSPADCFPRQLGGGRPNRRCAGVVLARERSNRSRGCFLGFGRGAAQSMGSDAAPPTQTGPRRSGWVRVRVRVASPGFG